MICPTCSFAGVLASMNPLDNLQAAPFPNSYIGPLVRSDLYSPVVDFTGVNYDISQAHSGQMGAYSDAMKAFDIVNFLFPS
jgi:hypothetical protein